MAYLKLYINHKLVDILGTLKSAEETKQNILNLPDNRLFLPGFQSS